MVSTNRTRFHATKPALTPGEREVERRWGEDRPSGPEACAGAENMDLCTAQTEVTDIQEEL